MKAINPSHKPAQTASRIKTRSISDAQKKAKLDFTRSLSRGEMSKILQAMRMENPDLARFISDIWGGVEQSLLAKYISEYDQKVEALR